MTELLKQIMDERADRLEAGGPDLDTIMKRGRSQARRRTAGLGAAGLVAAATAAVIAVPLLVNGGDGDRRVDEASSSVSALSWARGSTIHAAGGSIDVGREIHAYVATNSGHVLVDPEGTVWSAVDGAVDEVGQVPLRWDRLLVADGDRVAWLDVATDEWQFVVFDQATGDRVETAADAPDGVRRQLDGTSGEARASDPRDVFLADQLGVAALDGRLLWAMDARGVLAIDLLDHEARVEVFAPLSERYVVDDAAAGRLLLSRSTGEDDASGVGEETVLSPRRLDPGAPLPVRGGDLSPSAGYVMSENSADSSDDFTLYDLEAGVEIEVDANAVYDFFTGFAWLDDDSFLAVGMGKSGQGDEEWTVELLTCAVSTATCEVWTDGPGSITEETIGFQLPIGEHMG